jgi:hypothetical protein
MKSLTIIFAALLALLCGSLSQWGGAGNGSAAELRRFAIMVKNRKVEPAQRLIRVMRGDTLELELTTDEAAQLHLHGYDKLIKIAPGAPTTLRLDATIAGRFSIEAHGFASDKSGQRGHIVLLYLEVHPR